MTHVTFFVVAAALALFAGAAIFLGLRWSTRQAERYDAALFGGEPCRLRPPLRWLVLLLDGRDAVAFADRLSSAPQADRDAYARRMLAGRQIHEHLLMRIRAFRRRHGRWPRPGEIIFGQLYHDHHDRRR
jgi:hypothetical protein